MPISAQGPRTPQRKARIAKTIANIRLSDRRPPARVLTAHQQAAQDKEPPPLPVEASPATQQPITMAGVATQTDPVEPTQQVETPQIPTEKRGADAAPLPPAGKEPDPAIAVIHIMLIDLNAKVDRQAKSRSRSASLTKRPSRRRERSSRSSSSRSTTRSTSSKSERKRRSTSNSSRHRHYSRRRRSRSTSSRSTASRRHRNPTPPTSPRKIRAQQEARRKADRALEAQYPSLGSSQGKSLSKRDLVLRPYKSLPPDLKRKAEKRRSRRELTFPKHMCGLLSWVVTALDPATDEHAIITHASHIAQDAASIAWPAVREWTLACMDHIQGGKVSWHDTDLLNNERTSLSWIKGRSPEYITRAPCHLFNTDKCKEKEDHTAEGNIWLHVCALCYYMTGDERRTHAAPACWKKTGPKSTDEPRPDYKGKQQQFKKQNRDKRDAKPKN